MDKVTVEKLVKRFGKTGAVNQISFNVRQGESVVILGPSGCGKTTTLRAIAGFTTIEGGFILLDGREISSAGKIVPPEKRNMSMVFQNYAVWPHRTVFENVAYGLNIRRLNKSIINSRVQRALDRVQLSGLEKRYPSELSGGQQQRVALARAIVIEPDVLLLDEPLSNLDALLREEMRLELKDLQKELGITSIYVTHDQHEAMVLADRLIVLRDGVIEQIGPPEEAYLRPSSMFVANFLGVTNLLEGHVSSIRDGYAEIVLSDSTRLRAFVSDYGRDRLAGEGRGCISVRPVNLEIHRDDEGGDAPNRFPGEVKRRLFLGESFEYTVNALGMELKIRTLLHNLAEPGDRVTVGFNPENSICLPAV